MSADPFGGSRDGDRTCLALYQRHYSSRKRPAGAQGQIVGPGQHLVLRSDAGDAVFVWRFAEYRADGQRGVECSLFRNEGPALSSQLVRQADAIADLAWPGARHFTYVSAPRGNTHASECLAFATALVAAAKETTDAN